MAEKMTNAEYRAKEGISSSDLKMMAKSMAHYKYYSENPREDSPALLFGRAYHKYCLEPYDFDSEFIVAPKVDKRTKEGKAEWEKFLAESEGKDVIDQETFDTIDYMRTALYATPYAKKLIYGEHEQSFFWEEDGLVMKCRPDSFGKIGNTHICVDLKTTQCAETDAFMKDAIKFGYDIQASHYCKGLEANLGKKFEFIFIAQEKTPPYAVNILQADEYFMKSGEETREALLETYKKCLEKNEFPSYMGFSDEVEINSLGVPNWIKKTLDGIGDEINE